MCKLDVHDVEAQVQAEIEASKIHWSHLTSEYYSAVEGPAMNVSSRLS